MDASCRKFIGLLVIFPKLFYRKFKVYRSNVTSGTFPVRVVFSIPYGPSAFVVVYLREYGITWFNETIRFNGTFTVGGFSVSIPSWLLQLLAAVLGSISFSLHRS